MIVIGHRGARGEAPENTLAGLEYARRLGVVAFEVDIRLSADGQAVLLHDETVDRTTDGSGRAADLTVRELSELDARVEFPDWPEKVRVPTLDEALSILHDAKLLHLEIKSDSPERLEGLCQQVVDLVRKHSLAGRAAMLSFEPVVLEIMRRIAPEQPRALIGSYDSEDFVQKALQLGCAGACMGFQSTTADIVKLARSSGLWVTVWTVNDLDELGAVLDWDIAGVATDVPGKVISFLRRRGCLTTGIQQ